VAETLGLCRVLARFAAHAVGPRQGDAEALGLRKEPQNQARQKAAPLLVLVPPGRETLVGAAQEAGAHSCLMLPINAKDVASMVVHAQAGNHPGRHTLNLEAAQRDDRWRDDGGQG
jgi:hypothetical protein